MTNLMDTKQCKKCLTTKEISHFSYRNKSKNTRAPYCKSCHSLYDQQNWKTNTSRRIANGERNKDRRIRNKKFLWEYLSNNPCISCGENDPIVLEFDHRDRESKSMNVSEMAIRAYSISRIKAEISKCDVLCANCHRRRTAKQMGWYKSITDSTGT